MIKILRIAIVVLLLAVIAAIVTTQTQIYTSAPHVAPVHAEATPAIVSSPAIPSAAPPVPSALASVPALPLATTGTEASPLIVKLAGLPDPAEAVAEREKDRAILRGMDAHLTRLANTARAQNFLLLFEAIIYFLTLMLLYLTMESLKRFTTIAENAAESARHSAAIAQAVLEKTQK